jgi:Uncharacterised nucleotidyltransferase
MTDTEKKSVSRHRLEVLIVDADFEWVNTALGNIKAAIVGTFRAVRDLTQFNRAFRTLKVERPWADVQFLPRIGDEPSAGIGVGSMSRARKSIVGRLAKALTTNRLANAPPEFFIAAACSRWPPSETRSNSIRAAAKAPVDWERFLGIVDRHRLWGLARQGLAQASVAPPAEIESALNAKSSAVSRRNFALAVETARLCRLFREAAIPAVFVKGVTLSVVARQQQFSF